VEHHAAAASPDGTWGLNDGSGAQMHPDGTWGSNTDKGSVIQPDGSWDSNYGKGSQIYPDGWDYKRIMAITGHKTFSVFQRYNNPSEDDIKEVVLGIPPKKYTG
jgi:hypothetical protein